MLVVYYMSLIFKEYVKYIILPNIKTIQTYGILLPYCH